MTDEPLSELDKTREVGRLLSSYRPKEMSRPQLAAKVGVHPNSIKHVEAGYVKRPGDPTPRPTKLKREKLLDICNELQIPADVTARILSLSGYAPLDTVRQIVYLHGLSPEEADEVHEKLADIRRRRNAR